MSRQDPATARRQLDHHLDMLVRDVADFPRQGIVFKDITPLLGDPDAFSTVVEALAQAGRDDRGDVAVDLVVGIEARGFILGAPVALALGTGFVPVRKAGKLPGRTHAVHYALEYGDATLEMHRGAIGRGDRVLVVDDVLATGGTLAATAQMVERDGGSLSALVVLLELSFLKGREALDPWPLTALRTL